MTLMKLLFLGTGISVLSQAAQAEDASRTNLSTQGTTGAVDINAGVAVSEQFTDNVFLTANDRRSDFVTVLAPWVELSVNRENFRFSFDASAELGRFANNSNEDYEDFFLGMEARYRINDNVFAFGGLDHAWDHESRTSPDDVNGLFPTELQETSGYFGLGGSLGDRSFRLGLNARALDFDDTPAAGGGLIDNDDRDRVQFEFGGRLGVARTAQGEFFVQGIYDQRDYDERVDNGGAGFQRSSEGIQAAIGYSGDIGMMRGEVLAGVLSQDYDDPRFGTTTAVDYGANLTWQLGENTQLTGIVERTLEETTLSGASGYLSSTAGLRVRHRIASDMSFAGHFFLTENDYQGVPRTDILTETGVSLRYYINPNVYLDTEYDFLQRQSDVAGVEYDDHRITFRFGTRLEPQFDARTAVLAKANPWRPYAGVQLGHAGFQTKVDGPRGGGGGNLTADFGDTGPSAGIFAGYRTEIGDLSLGFEIGADTSDASWSHVGDRTFTAAREESIDISAMTGFRTGQNNLVYGRFGLVASRFASTYQSDPNPTVRQTDEELGLMAGIGTEIPLGNGMSGRMEYLLRAYDDYSISPTPGGNADNFAHVESLVRFGLVYDFGPGSAPADPPYATDFSGPYAGVQLGHGTLQSDNTGPRPNAAAPSFILDATRGGQGFTGGVVAGFGHISDRFYVGAEGELEVSSADWNIERNPTGRIYSVEKLGTLGASLRAGYVINDSVLVYGRAGVVTSRFNTTYSTTGNSVDQDDDLFGVRIGAGVEFALSPDTNIRFDYTQTEYDSHSVDYGGGVDQFDTSERLFRVGVTRQF